MTTPTRARRDKEKEKRRKTILDAAEKVIAKRGLEKANFGEIATRTRLSRSLVYVYFPTKEDLFHAVCDRGLTRLEDRFRAAAAAHQQGLEQVMAMGQAYHDFAREEPLYFSMMAELQQRETPEADDLEGEDHPHAEGRECLQLVAEALARGVQDGSVKPAIGHPGATALSVWAFTHGLIQISEKKAEMISASFGLNAAELITHGLGLLRAGLAAEAPPTARRR